MKNFLASKASLILLPLFFLVIPLLFLHPFEGGGDFYHHVNTGKQIIEQGTFPFTDIYTHTAEGKEWIAYAWGSGILLYLVFTHLGPIGISLLVALTGTLTILLLYYLLRLSSISKSISFLTIIFSLGPILTRFPNRPEIFTYPLILLILIVDNLRQKNPKLSWLFPLIILTWTNLYGSSVIAGIGLIFLLIIKQFITDNIKLLKHQRLLYITGLIALIAAFINPNTYKSVLYMFLYIPKVSEYEGEWAGIWTILNYTPDSYILTYQYLILIYLIFIILFISVSLLSWKHFLKNKLFLLLGLAIIVPIFAFRHLPLAAILSTPFIAHLLNQLKNKYLNALFILSGIFMIFLMLWLRPVGLTANTSSPDNLINFLKSNNLTGKSFNHSTTGSFLSYGLYPQIKIFFDTRDDLFKNNQAFTDLYNAQMSSQSIIPLLEKYQIDLVVADFFTDGLNYRHLFDSPSWAVVYFDDRYFVAIPTQTAKAKNIEPILSIDPFSPSGSKPGTEPQAEIYYKNLTKTPSNQLLLVQTLLAQNKNHEAINILQNLNMPGDLTKILLQKQQDYFLTKLYLEIFDCQNATFYINRLQDDIEGNFIFAPNRKLELIDDDLQALYHSGCLGDKAKGDYYMKQYLNRKDINTKEKIKFQHRYSSIRVN